MAKIKSYQNRNHLTEWRIKFCGAASTYVISTIAIMSICRSDVFIAFALIAMPDVLIAGTPPPSSGGPIHLSAGINGSGAQRIIQSLKSGSPLSRKGGPYDIAGTVQIGSHQVLACESGAEIHQTLPNAVTFEVVGDHAKIQNCRVVGGGAAAVVLGSDFTWDGGGGEGTGGLFLRADLFRVSRTSWTRGSGTAVNIDRQVGHWAVIGNDFENNVGFGIWVTNGAHDGLIQKNSTKTNGIELVGITYDSHDIKVLDNDASKTGDNCFSFSGYRITALRNTASECAYTGVYSYGGKNNIINNKSVDNGQVHNPLFQPLVGPDMHRGNGYDPTNHLHYSGFSGRGGYGGSGQSSVFSQNTADDDQIIRTQDYGFSWGIGYQIWQPNIYMKLNTYFYYKKNIYKVIKAGLSTNQPPSLELKNNESSSYQINQISTFDIDTPESANNVFISNKVIRYGIMPYKDTTLQHKNILCR